jgi:AcrR family transcriptional regulator
MSPASASGLKSDEGSRRTRQALIEAAAEAFVTQGYDTVTLRDVARGSGLTTGAIYHHFRNKAELLTAVIEREVTRHIAPREATTPGVRIETLEAFLRAYPERRTLRLLMQQGAAAARTDPSLAAGIAALQRAAFSRWQGFYAEWQASGRLKAQIRPDLLVTVLWAAELGLAELEATQSPTPSGDDWASAWSLLLGLQPAPE